MNKKLLTLAVAVAVAAPMAVMAEATMYGKIRQAVEYVDGDLASEGQWQIRDYSSRIGVKGSEDLGNGLKGIYKMEFGVNISQNPKTPAQGFWDNNPNEFSQADSTITARNAYVGLAADWGTFLVGRHDTPLKISTGSLDYFSDQAGDYNSLPNNVSGFGFSDRRANGTVAYISPNMGGLTVAGAIVPGEEAISNTAATDLADAYSVAAMYSNAGFFASAAYEGAEMWTNALGGAGPLDQWRVGLGYDGGEFKVAAVYENEQIDSPANIDADRWMINGAYNFGNNSIKAKYQDGDLNTAVGGGDMWSIGFDHNFTKRTQFNAGYSDYSGDAAGTDAQIFSLGLNHEF